MEKQTNGREETEINARILFDCAQEVASRIEAYEDETYIHNNRINLVK